ncbi:MAG: amino acid--[acyl-carrier-protein] ligase [Acidimicrobiales bacterium]|jgi:seryl-tRNA synthetase
MTTDFRSALLASGLLVETGVDGLYGRSGTFEKVVRGIDDLVTAAGADQDASVLHFPAVMPRPVLERTGYPRSFPNLLGSVSVFDGGDEEHVELLERLTHGGTWVELLTPSDVSLCSAGCHPLYPLCSGRLPAGGRRFEVFGQCFRHEPSLDPARMQAFRMHEFVYLGDPDGAVAHRDLWLGRSADLLSGLGLKVETVVANDPFFGRTGRMLALNQRTDTLKYEITCAIHPDSEPTAISSCNYHLDHFGTGFEIESDDGSIAHTACVGFGVERITLALLGTHGLDPDRWPVAVRSRLW